MNSRRGASVIISAILLIGVAVSAALVLWSAFIFPSVPQSDINQVLEDVRIVKVTPEDGRVMVYVINRGATDALVDSVYLESPFGDLDQQYPIPITPIAPGEIKPIPLEIDLTMDKPVGIKVVTVEGKQSSVLVMNASEVASPETTPEILVSYFDKLPYELIYYNGTSKDFSYDDTLQEINLESVLMSTNETIINATSGVAPIEVECENVTRINDFLWHSEDKLKKQDLYLRVVYGGSLGVSHVERIILQMELQITPKPNQLEIKFYNWTSGAYVTSGPGYMYVDVNRTNWDIVSMMVSEPDDFIAADGSYKFAVDTMHYAGEDNSIVNFKLLTIAVVSSTSSQLLDSTFVFTLPAGVSPEELASMDFTMTYCFDYNPIVFDFRIYNYSASNWNTVKSIAYVLPGDYTTEDLSVEGNLSDYVSSDGKVKINLYSVVYGAPVFEISIDVLRLRIGAVTIE
ncbi:MAG: hypothetical protein ABC542_02180 [Candidatus Methanosuratincola petrocarbonis]